MREDKIELHTIGTFRGEEYEMQDLLNGLLEENHRLNNILDKFEEELEKEINIKEEDVEVEHERFVAIHDTLENVLSRFLLIKGVEPLTENDKKQVKWLKDELKVGDDKE